MDLSNFDFSKVSLPTLAITIIVVGFILSYIFSFIGKLIRFIVLAIAGIFLILYYSGYKLNSKSIQKFMENIKSYITKLTSKVTNNLNTLQIQNINTDLKNKKRLENSNLTLPNVKDAKKALIEILNKSHEQKQR